MYVILVGKGGREKPCPVEWVDHGHLCFDGHTAPMTDISFKTIGLLTADFIFTYSHYNHNPYNVYLHLN